MQNSEQHATPECAAIAPTDAAAPSELAMVPTADGSHVPRYGAMPYGGPQAPEPRQED